jgi:hypothetical protein
MALIADFADPQHRALALSDPGKPNDCGSVDSYFEALSGDLDVVGTDPIGADWWKIVHVEPLGDT